MAKVSDGKVVQEDYLHITGETPIRLGDQAVAEMPTEEHSQFVPKEGEPIRLHHQMAGLRGK
jgi:hypothetical protein